MKVGKNVVEYTVMNLTDLIKVLITFFSKYPLKNIETKDFI
ncbi:hypothetical protein PDL02_20585 [Bacillus cereus group sp. LD113LC]|nr:MULTISPECIES: hypothetical protein [unclassified Bacillus cereus group]MDA1542430.1 hypothetical protein [Bacillus cereus group sp. TH244-1LC]MDA1621255.1 hypothetical protein [Bacillus cereus group sp. TH206-1LC]MDA1751909.1 hypothetical protein [Bacillus cereus group sp. LD113LC]